MKLLRISVLTFFLLIGCSGEVRRAPLAPAFTPVPESAHVGGQGTDIGGAIELPHAGRLGRAWFLDSSRSILTCVRTADPSLRPLLKRKIDRAFFVWTDYILRKHLTRDLPAERKLSRWLSWLSACDGSEDLRFDIGVESPELSHHSGVVKDSFGLAVRSRGQERTEWAKGFIWIDGRSPFPGETALDLHHSVVDVALLHELGHVFGNGHVPGTIMDGDIARMFHPEPEIMGDLFEIDLGRELFATGGDEYHSDMLAPEIWKKVGSYFFEAPSTNVRWGIVRLRRHSADVWHELSLHGSDGNVRVRSLADSPNQVSRTIDEFPSFRLGSLSGIWQVVSRTRHQRYWIRSGEQWSILQIWEGVEPFGSRKPVRIELERPGETTLTFSLTPEAPELLDVYPREVR